MTPSPIVRYHLITVRDSQVLYLREYNTKTKQCSWSGKVGEGWELFGDADGLLTMMGRHDVAIIKYSGWNIR